MKTMIAAALVLLSSGAAIAEIGPANSTNQHQRDSADFYDSVPDLELLGRDRASGVPFDREANNRHDHRRVIAQ